VFIADCGETSDAQTTPDGRFLVFTSGCHLTPGDTSAARQVFLYDAQSGSVVRVSSGVEGYNNDGNVTGEDPHGELDAHIVHQPVGASLGGRGGALARSMSDDGSYVFFESPVGLVPQALSEVFVASNPENGYPLYAENVYEYHDGRVWLIGSDSSNEHLQPRYPVLIGVSASGGDVFFRTSNQLVMGDTDTLIDFYDARVDGGFPAPVTPAGCVGDACQGAPSVAPAFGAPSSVVFAGPGNLPAAVSTPVVAVKKGLTVAQKLARALQACAKRPRRERASCEAKARRLYGHSARAVKSDRRGK